MLYWKGKTERSDASEYCKDSRHSNTAGCTPVFTRMDEMVNQVALKIIGTHGNCMIILNIGGDHRFGPTSNPNQDRLPSLP